MTVATTMLTMTVAKGHDGVKIMNANLEEAANK